MSTAVAICLHCQQPRSLAARGLCWVCHKDPDVRDLYPCRAPGRQPEGPTVGDSRQSADPTPALPGTAEKMAVMEERARAGESLFHPEDGRVPGVRRQESDGLILDP